MDAALQLFLRHGYRKVSMSDIAQATQMSRPSLYAAFANKEAIFAAQVARQRALCMAETAQRVRDTQDLQTQLRHLFDIWVLEPVAAVIDSDNGIDLVANCGVYAPAALDALYQQMETTLVQLLSPHVRDDSAMSAADIAYILRLATTSLKASADNVTVLRRLIAGLIHMALATVGAGRDASPAATAAPTDKKKTARR
ncbi:TetR/AcrR family transcriptional regulator [Xanthomonas sp. 3075]|uniref:TetR/AcrR family transcriptional regulator n=1 Tax=Xanthomonas sp. 3075 TaxID=3035315 RepID=UPI00183A33FA|nr:TetR/AcrR family transcriptional regulator [Xanthomonas sp. 3075]MBB4130446.1 AcrR family transcriptional regulator [Xanthomonas sp. 3075]